MGLRRALGLGPLTFFGVGMILGAGVYSVIGPAAGKAGDALWLAFAISSAIALLTALSYAELATMLPNAGAEFAYLAEAFPAHRWIGFVVGLTVVAVGVATAATVALAFGGYLRSFVDVPAQMSALALLIAMTAVNLAGIRESSGFNIVLTSIEALGLVVAIAAGVTRTESVATAFPLNAAPGLLGAAALVFFAYLGFENIANLAEEAKAPGKDLPRSILLSLVVTTVLYILVGAAAVTLLRPEELARSDAPLADAVATASPRLGGVVSGIALFATANTALIAVLAASRVLYAMARAGALPAALGAVRAKSKVPWLATTIVFSGAAALLPLGSVEITASLASLGALVAFTGVHAAVLVLRRRSPDAKRPFRVPVELRGVPVPPVLGAAAAILLATQFREAVLIAGVVALAVFVTAYFVLHGLKRTAA